MYEEITHDTLLEDMQDEVIDDMNENADVDVNDGSLFYNDVSAAAYELEKIYRQLDYLHTELDPEQADFDGMVLLAKQRYLTPRQPTYAVGKMSCIPSVSTGTRFSIGDYTYSVTKDLGSNTYECTCEQSGSGPNNTIGDMDPIDYIDNFESAKLIEITTKGQDLETKDELYQRYIANLHADGFAGNISAYEAYCLSKDGVGGIRMATADDWKGGSTCLIVLLDSDHKPVTETFCTNLLAQICPQPKKGKGMAPIGADVTIRPAEGVTCNITGMFTFEDGVTMDSVNANLVAAADTYFASIRSAWSGADYGTNVMVYASRLLTALLGVTGVVDILDMKINGSAGNVTLNWDQVPIAGSVTANG